MVRKRVEWILVKPLAVRANILREKKKMDVKVKKKRYCLAKKGSFL